MAIDTTVKHVFTVVNDPEADPLYASVLAMKILKHKKITLAESHVSGVQDKATSKSNCRQVLFMMQAKRSEYQNAPGGSVKIDVRLLKAILQLADYYSFSISEITGASHSTGSKHYSGLAFDVNFINGKRADASNPNLRSFMNDCISMSADSVIGPPSLGHETHVHVGWATE